MYKELNYSQSHAESRAGELLDKVMQDLYNLGMVGEFDRFCSQSVTTRDGNEVFLSGRLCVSTTNRSQAVEGIYTDQMVKALTERGYTITVRDDDQEDLTTSMKGLIK